MKVGRSLAAAKPRTSGRTMPVLMTSYVSSPAEAPLAQCAMIFCRRPSRNRRESGRPEFGRKVSTPSLMMSAVKCHRTSFRSSLRRPVYPACVSRVCSDRWTPRSRTTRNICSRMGTNSGATCDPSSSLIAWYASSAIETKRVSSQGASWVCLRNVSRGTERMAMSRNVGSRPAVFRRPLGSWDPLLDTDDSRSFVFSGASGPSSSFSRR
ncbi:hypothetical protein VTN02DRAFT_6083 [Thermoascus thermophilus]